MIDRPARVDMRARNPCLRARFRRLGWKVRFIALVLQNLFHVPASHKWPTKEGNCNFFTIFKQDSMIVSLF